MHKNIENIRPGIFRIALPLLDLSLQTVNTYLFKGKKRNLLIDSGINEKDCREALGKALHELEVNLEETDFFTTHLHEDHFGLAPEIAPDNSTIYLNAPETIFWGSFSEWAENFEHGRVNGFPEEGVESLSRGTPKFLTILPLKEMRNAVKSYRGEKAPDGRIKIIGDGEILNVGDFTLQCIMTPGHTSGHLCLYEPEQKLLFSGDHLLETITPGIFLWPGENRNPLQEFLESLDKVCKLEVKLVLPGHRNTFRNHRSRISELKKHHNHREQEIKRILGFYKKSGRNAYEIASEVSWTIPLPWEQFTIQLKWMALAETLAHLQYMNQQDKVTSKLPEDGVERYFLLER